LQNEKKYYKAWREKQLDERPDLTITRFIANMFVNGTERVYSMP